MNSYISFLREARVLFIELLGDTIIEDKLNENINLIRIVQ